MKIHPLTYLYLFLAFISRSSYYVAFLLFSILHEIGHYLVALYFSFEIEKIMILPFGAFLLLKDLGKHYVYEEILILANNGSFIKRKKIKQIRLINGPQRSIPISS